MPYTHSLLAVIIWSILGGIWYRYVSGYRGGNAAAILVGVAVLSHWFEDFMVHKDGEVSKYSFNNVPQTRNVF